MSARSIVIETIKTSDPDRVIEVEVSYNNGDLNRKSRGYWLSARVWRNEGMFRSTDIFGGSKSTMLEPAERFNARKLAELVDSFPKTDSPATDSAIGARLVDAIRDQMGI